MRDADLFVSSGFCSLALWFNVSCYTLNVDKNSMCKIRTLETFVSLKVYHVLITTRINMLRKL